MSSARQRGFTLIELIIFIVVVGAGLAGILSVMNTVVKSSADPLVRKQTIAIAESLLEEIVQKEYAKPTGSTANGFAAGGARASYDCVDDYNTYNAATIVDLNGNAAAGLTGYSVASVSVVPTTALTGVAAKKITVTASGPGSTSIALTAYRSNY